MPSVRSSASKRYACVVAIILLLGEVMPTYSYCILKGLVYIIIIGPLGHQPSFYIKYIKLNMRSPYNIKLVFNTKCAFFIHSYIL